MSLCIASDYYRPHYGGVENSLFYLGHAFLKSGLSPVIVAGNGGPSGEMLPASELRDGLEVRRYCQASRFSRLIGTGYSRDITNARVLVQRLHNQNPFSRAVVRGIQSGIGVRAALPGVPVEYVMPGVVKFHDQPHAAARGGTLKQRIVRMRHAYLHYPYQQRLQARLVAVSDRLWVFSDSMRRQVVNTFPDCEEKIGRLNPGVDIERFRPAQSRERMRSRLGLKSHGPIVLGVGRMIHIKGFDLAIRAFAALPSELSGQLVLVGDGPELPALRALAAGLPEPQRIVFKGRQTNVEDYYAAADVFLMPSRYESFCQAILEALASGLPTVAFAQGGEEKITTASAEILRFPFGITCDSTPADLARAIARLLSMSAAVRQAWGEEGRRHVLTHYSWTECARALAKQGSSNESDRKNT